MAELDQVLGGGIVPGSLVLVGGDPGIGKSTLLLQVCRNLADRLEQVLYISGEESLQQIKLRAVRIGEFSDSLKLLCETESFGYRSGCPEKQAAGGDYRLYPDHVPGRDFFGTRKCLTGA